MSPIRSTIATSSPTNTTILSGMPQNMMPLSLITNSKNNQFLSDLNQNGINLSTSTMNASKLTTSTINTIPSGMTLVTSSVTTSAPQYINTNGQTPLNLNATAATFAGGACLQIIGPAPPSQSNSRDLTGKNGYRQTEIREMPQQSIIINSNYVKDKMAPVNTVGQISEPPAKVFKLVNGSRQLTLSQVLFANKIII